MLGGMLAGHEECAGETVEVNGEFFKVFYGMSSDTAMKTCCHGYVVFLVANSLLTTYCVLHTTHNLLPIK